MGQNLHNQNNCIYLNKTVLHKCLVYNVSRCHTLLSLSSSFFSHSKSLYLRRTHESFSLKMGRFVYNSTRKAEQVIFIILNIRLQIRQNRPFLSTQFRNDVFATVKLCTKRLYNASQ